MRSLGLIEISLLEDAVTAMFSIGSLSKLSFAPFLPQSTNSSGRHHSNLFVACECPQAPLSLDDIRPLQESEDKNPKDFFPDCPHFEGCLYPMRPPKSR
jgi:hypothetical protein